MRNITRFQGMRITIDHKLGTIFQQSAQGSCEFISREEDGIRTMRITGKWVTQHPNGSYHIREEFEDRSYGSAQTIQPIMTSWLTGEWQNPRFEVYDQALKRAGL